MCRTDTKAKDNPRTCFDQNEGRHFIAKGFSNSFCDNVRNGLLTPTQFTKLHSTTPEHLRLLVTFLYLRLAALGAKPKVIQALEAESREALDKLMGLMG